VVVDGNRRIPGLELEQLVVVDGDRLSQAVGAFPGSPLSWLRLGPA
jgi:hypothetical protein